MKTMKSFHPESKEWREEPSMNLPRKYLTLATIQKEKGKDDHILALRGYDLSRILIFVKNRHRKIFLKITVSHFVYFSYLVSPPFCSSCFTSDKGVNTEFARK